MPARHWSIWSLTPDRSRWMEVEEDLTEREATATAEQRTKVAHEHGIPDAQYVAMPKGEKPGPEHVKTLTAEQRVTAQVGPDRLARDLADAAEEDGYDGLILGVNTPPAGRWFDDYTEIVKFGQVLYAADRFGEPEAQSVLYYFEKPWKWDNEHDAWVKRGQPIEAGQHDWDGFLHDTEVLDP
jgi:hypothetical protein